MSSPIVEVEGIEYVPLSLAIHRIRDLATMSSGAAVVAALGAISSFIVEEVIEKQTINVPQLARFLEDQSMNYEFIEKFAKSAVMETLGALVENGFITPPEDE